MSRIEFPFASSVEGARALRRELKGFLRHLRRKMAGEIPDDGDTATLAYVVARAFFARLDQELKDLKAAERIAKEREERRRAPKTRDKWRKQK